MTDYKHYFKGFMGGIAGILISHPVDTYRVNYQTFNKIKFSQLYRGVLPPLLSVSIEKAIVFGIFNNINDNNHFRNGLIAGTIASLLITPADRIKIQLQTKSHKLSFNNIFRGFTPTLFRDGLGYALYFKIYNAFASKQDSPLDTFMKGGMTGSITWMFIYPFDYIKTNIQNGSTYSDLIGYFYIHGLKSIYRGIGFALLRAFCMHGGVFMGYNYMNNV